MKTQTQTTQTQQEQDAHTNTCSGLYDNMKAALAEGEKQAGDVTAQIETLQRLHEKILANNARLRGGIEGMEQVNGVSAAPAAAKPNGKVAAKPAPKAAPAKKAAAKPGPAKKAAPAPAKKAAAKPAGAKPAAAKPGPKPATPKRQATAPKAKAAPAKKAPAAKAGAKKAASKANGKGKANTSNAAEGRRAVARGDRPTMKEAIATVMGKQTMGAAEVVEGLQKRGWMPNANDPQQYISYMLSSTKDVFERLERGQYKVREGVVFAKKQAKKGADTAAKKPATANSSGKKSTDEELGELGLKPGQNVASNPFV